MTLKQFTKELTARGFLWDGQNTPSRIRYCLSITNKNWKGSQQGVIVFFVYVGLIPHENNLSMGVDFTIHHEYISKSFVDADYGSILKYIDDAIQKRKAVVSTLNYHEVNIHRMKLPYKLRRFFCTNPEDMEEAKREWRRLVNDPRYRRQLNIGDFIFASILFGGDWTKCVARSRNESKIRHMNKQLRCLKNSSFYKPILFQLVPGLRFNRVRQAFYNGPDTIDEFDARWTYDAAPTRECFLAWDKEDHN